MTAKFSPLATVKKSNYCTVATLQPRQRNLISKELLALMVERERMRSVALGTRKHSAS
jgi:mannitol/fructose-specific phosphotransferase system IIA component